MKKRDDVLVGLMVTVTVFVLVLGSLWLARGGLSKGYPLYAKFPWGAGLKQGQPVWLVGVSVGYVDNVELKQNGTLITTLRIEKQYKVPLGTIATVVANGIFGDQAVALTPAHPDSRSFSPGDTVPVGPNAPGIAQLTSKADSIATSVNAMTTAMQKELIAAGGIRDLHQALAGTNRLIAELGVIAAEQSKQLNATEESVRRVTTAVNPVKVDSVVTNLQTASANMSAMTTDLRATSAKLNAIIAKVDSGPGSAAMLINNPGLYNDMRALLARMDSLVADVKAHPSRYINVRVF